MDISLLEQMIHTPSVFPNEASLAALLDTQLQQRGFAVTRQTVGEGRFNLLAEKGTGSKALMFYGHLDTVPCYGTWRTDPYQLTAQGDQLFGLGTADMKGGIFAILEAVKDLDIPGDRTLKIALCVDEENESVGAYALSDHPFLDDVRLIISAESSEGQADVQSDKPIFLGRRGRVGMTITVPGISSHGAYPERGVNAILEAYKVIAALETMPMPTHEQLGAGCQFIQEIAARSGSLSVPDRCDVYLSRNLVPPETPESALGEVRRFLDQLYAKGTLQPLNGQKAQVALAERTMPYYRPYLTDPHLSLIHNLIQMLETRHFERVVIHYGMSVADENIFGGTNNIPTVSLGPEGNNMHSADEWVSQQSLARLIPVYRDIIQQLEL